MEGAPCGGGGGGYIGGGAGGGCQTKMCRSLLYLLLLALVQAGYHHLPWQQQHLKPQQKWGKSNRQPRIRTGQGRYRMDQGLAELSCEFPRQYHIMSNVIWERADLSGLDSLNELYKSAGEEHKYRVVTWPQGSRLQLMSPSPRARGLYRCLATGMGPGYPYPVTLFQDVPFYPDMRRKWLEEISPPLPPPLPPRKPCCRGLTYDDYRAEYHVKSSHYFQ